jgi:energy-coupling factor transport system ATP-binding protein
MEGRTVKLVLDHLTIVRDNFSLTANGEFSEGIHLVSGAVGSGKSTLALAIAGLISSGSGSVVRDGIGPVMLSFQFPEYHVTGMTLTEECLSWGCDPKEIFSLSDLQGKNHQSPFSLSRGELKQFHLSCLLNRHYDLLLLDEPFGSLDCETKRETCNRLSQLTNGITIIFTHEQTILPKVDRIWEIMNGMLLDRGTLPDAIRRWCGAPSLIKKLIKQGQIPHNISYDDVLEALCRM